MIRQCVSGLMAVAVVGCSAPLTQEQKEAKFVEMYKAEMTAQGFGDSVYVTKLSIATTANAQLICAQLDVKIPLSKIVESNAKASFPYLTEDMLPAAEADVVVLAVTAIRVLCPQHKDELEAI